MGDGIAGQFGNGSDARGHHDAILVNFTVRVEIFKMAEISLGIFLPRKVAGFPSAARSVPA